MSVNTKLHLRKSYIKEDGTCKVYLRVTINRAIHWINLDVSVAPNLWNDSSSDKKIKKEHPRDKVLNMKINKAKRKLDDIIDQFELKGTLITFGILKQSFFGGSTDNFFDFVGQEIERRHKMKELSYETYRNDKNKIERIKEFKHDLQFNQITKDYLDRLLEWLIYEEGNARNTANKKLSLIRTYLKKARVKGLTENNPFEDIRLIHEPTEREILTAKEVVLLDKLLDSGSLPSKLHNVLHFFLIACYTGFRFSDYYKFNSYKDEKQFSITMAKTKRDITVPIVNRAKELLNGQFHIVSNQKTNDALKEIMKIANIDKLITTHSARHTFAIRLLEKGRTLKEVQMLLGHANYNSTLVYAKYVPNSRLETIMNDFSYE